MISVVISTYNRAEKFLPRAIDSVLNQSYKDWELIIVDDCSTDNTEEVVKSYNHSKITYLKLDKNSGSDTKPKNEGTKLAKGKYLAYLDDDVEYRKHALRTLVGYLEKHPEVDVAYGDMWIEPMGEPGIARDFDAQFLMLRNYIDTSSAVMKRQAMFDIGGWDETLPKYVDWNVFVRLAKYGKKFKRIKKFTFNYHIHKDTKSQKVEAETYNHPVLGTLFVPTFNPSGCYIRLPYLSNSDKPPRVAIFTIHYNRPEYSKATYKEMKETAGYDFDWFCWDNSTNDETIDWLETVDTRLISTQSKNVGITHASNRLIDEIMDRGDYDIIIKIDNDVEFQTMNWLPDLIDLWKRNRMIYVSPYVEGLLHNPGGAPRAGYGMIGDEFVEVTNHIGGIFAMISADAYNDFRWQDDLLHGDQDTEASYAFRGMGYMPCYYPKHRIMHRDSTKGQMEKDKKYHKKRKDEKKQVA